MMQTLNKLLSFAILLIFLASSQNPQPAFAQTIVPVRLVLKTPHDLSPREIPILKNPVQIDEYINEIINRHAAPLLVTLTRFRDDGIITSFNLLPNQLIIDVLTSDPERLSRELNATGDPENILFSYPLDQSIPECVKTEPERFRHYIADLAQARLGMQVSQGTNSKISSALSEPVPSPIEIGLTKGGYTTTFGGTVMPNRLVTMKLLRNGTLLLTKATNSGADGSYFFDVYQQGCLNGNYLYIQESDQIIVEDGLAAYSTIAQGVSVSSLDPFKDSLNGSTSSGRSVLVELHNLDTSNTSGQLDCLGMVGLFMITPDPLTGDFSTVLPDFNSSAWATVSAYDTANNRTYYTVQAYRIWNRDLSYAYVWFKPKTTYTVQIIREGQIFYSEEMTTSAAGVIVLDGGPWAFLPGDTIQASGEGETLSLTPYFFYPPADVQVDLAAKKITGKITPNRLIRAEITHYSVFKAGCSINACVSEYADADGNYSLTIPDMLPGDRFDFTIYDEQGNQEYDPKNLPIIVVDPSSRVISGSWSQSYSQYYLKIRIKDSAGNLLKEVTTFTYGSFYENFSIPLLPGYIVEVGYALYWNPTVITLGSLETRVHLGQDKLTGTASIGQLFVNFNDFQPEYNRTETICNLTDVNGRFQLDLPRVTNSSDTVQTVLVQPDGVVMITNARAFQLSIGQYGLGGYTETPGTLVEITHTHKGEVLPTVSVTASTYDASFAYRLAAMADPGDKIDIKTSDGVSTVVFVPDLNASLDAQNNRILGHTDPNQQVLITLQHKSNAGYENRKLNTQSDENGNFVYQLNGQLWSRNCSGVSAADACTWFNLTAYTVETFVIYRNNEEPPAPLDSFEPNDNEPIGATIFMPNQTHTFHTGSDEDWYRFPVLPGKTGSYSFALAYKGYLQGYSIPFKGTLYRQGQETPIQDFILPSLSEAGLPISFTLSEPGEYTLRVAPADNSAGSVCDLKYQLSISPSPWVRYLYLPTIRSNNQP